MPMAAPLANWLPRKAREVHVDGGHVRGGVVQPGHGEDEVKDLQGDVPQDDHGRKGDGGEHGKDDPAEELPLARPVHPGGLEDLHGDPLSPAR